MDSTELSELLGSGPVQSPAFAPMVTGGDPFIAPLSTKPSVDYSQQFSMLRYSVRGLLSYVSYFLAAVIISLPVPRNLILQYIPNTYTSGGVVSYTGAAILGGAAIVISYVLTTLLHTLF